MRWEKIQNFLSSGTIRLSLPPRRLGYVARNEMFCVWHPSTILKLHHRLSITTKLPLHQEYAISLLAPHGTSTTPEHGALVPCGHPRFCAACADTVTNIHGNGSRLTVQIGHKVVFDMKRVCGYARCRATLVYNTRIDTLTLY